MYNIFYDEYINIYDIDIDSIITNNYKWIFIDNYQDFLDCIKKNGLPYLINYGSDILNIIDDNMYYFLNNELWYKWLTKYCNDNNFKLPNTINHSTKDNIIDIFFKMV